MRVQNFFYTNTIAAEESATITQIFSLLNGETVKELRVYAQCNTEVLNSIYPSGSIPFDIPFVPGTGNIDLANSDTEHFNTSNSFGIIVYSNSILNTNIIKGFENYDNSVIVDSATSTSKLFTFNSYKRLINVKIPYAFKNESGQTINIPLLIEIANYVNYSNNVSTIISILSE